jgi:hypothetical protein
MENCCSGDDEHNWPNGIPPSEFWQFGSARVLNAKQARFSARGVPRLMILRNARDPGVTRVTAGIPPAKRNPVVTRSRAVHLDATRESMCVNY